MSADQGNPNDPLAFVRNLWGGMGFNLPGMVTPTFDVEELDKRIKDMKAVEGWLRMNLSMLQMTIQGLEMQRTTVSTVKTMSQMASDAMHAANPETAAPAVAEAPAGAFSEAAMWPWQMMQQMREKIEQQAAAASETPAESATEKATRRKK